MNLKHLKKIFTLFLIFTISIGALSACGNNTKDEGGTGDATSDGTDGSAGNSSTEEDLSGTDTSDATGEGNEVDGDDTPATEVNATVITEEEMSSIVENALNGTATTIYNEAYQDEVENQLEVLKQEADYNLDNPLFVMNPFGTNRLGMYMYLNTEEDSFLEYTISVEDQMIYDFTRHLYTDEDTEPMSEHENHIIGLVPGMTNTITLRSYDEDNKITDKYVYTIDVPESKTIAKPILDVRQVESLEELSDGLFCLFATDLEGNIDTGHILFYDNTGVVRGEIPLESTSAATRIEFVDENILYPYSENQFALVDHRGKVEYIYTLDGFTLHHDFDYDEDEDCIIALATNESRQTTEDSIVLLDLQSGNYEELFNFSNLFPDIIKQATTTATSANVDGLGWIQLNSIQIQDTDNIIVSSRELNSIIKVDDIRDNPEISYIISDSSFWDSTNYTDYVFDLSGSFNPHVGQYSLSYEKDDSLDDGQYYLHLFNNNYGNSTAYSNFDFSDITGVGSADEDADNSYYYKYLVDEDAKTFELTENFPVPYSKVLGSTQDIDGNRVVASSLAGVFGEYDSEGNLIAEYTVDFETIYRVFKYRMDGYWFN